jgi:hypothetical protein
LRINKVNIETGHEPRKTESKTDLEEMDTMDLKDITKHQEVSNEEATVETMGALVDQYWDWDLTIGSHRQLKKWT